jgi:CubicO group peptidase (beta-lactamase class C family)
MHLDTKNDVFSDLNQYVFEIKNLISASAASVLIIQNGIIVNEWYSGYHESTEGGRLVDAESQFNIASIRKTYLGFAISLALYEGRINSLKDHVTNYLEDIDEKRCRYYNNSSFVNAHTRFI